MQMQEEQTDAKLHKPAKCSISVSYYTVLVTNVHIRPTDNIPPYNKESSHSTGCHIPTRPLFITHNGTVIIQQLTSCYIFPPQTSMGTFAGSAFT